MTTTFSLRLMAATFALGVTSLPAVAQDSFALPAQCGVEAAMDHGAMGHGDAAMDMGAMDMGDAPAHVQENMARMDITMPAMEQGMMNEDPNVAFACGMIAHHQGAIDMAQVLIAHGDDPQMLELANEIIAAQQVEIEEMTTWLESYVQ